MKYKVLIFNATETVKLGSSGNFEFNSLKEARARAKELSATLEHGSKIVIQSEVVRTLNEYTVSHSTVTVPTLVEQEQATE